MKKLQDLFALIGRIALAGIFVKSGIGKIGGFAATAGYIASKGLPLPEVGAAIAIVVEVVAGIALIIGWKARWAALAIAVFTAAATLIFHAYWTLPADKQYPEMLAFWKNLAIIGGMLMVMAFGAGRFSVDRGRD
ncbi:MAG: DoxX family protein [Pseudomonadota bacterium]